MFRQLIPAETLEAWYDRMTRQLTLKAVGKAMEYTSAIEFASLPAIPGQLAYALEGWVGPITGKTQPYEHVQSFQRGPPRPGEVVLIRISNASDPKVVKIQQVEWPSDGGIGPVITPQTDTTAELTSKVLLPVQETEDIPVFALKDKPFDITYTPEEIVEKTGSVTMKSDPAYLTLNTAGVRQGKLFWNFTPKQVGTTQVVLTINGGIATYWTSQTYNVTVFWLPSGPVTHGPIIDNPYMILPVPNTNSEANGNGHTDTTTTKSKSKTNGSTEPPPELRLSFLGRVFVAMRIVQEKYPDAQLYHVKATTPDPNGASDTYGLTLMECRFFAADGGTVIIRSVGYNVWEAPIYRPGMVIGVATLLWPFVMTAEDADKMMRGSGRKANIRELDCGRPLGPGPQANIYGFTLVDGDYYNVDDRVFDESDEAQTKDTGVEAKPVQPEQGAIAVR